MLSRKKSDGEKRTVRFMILIAAFLLLAPPIAALGAVRMTESTQVTYFTGSAGSWTGHASGLTVPRDYNHMYHSCSNYASGYGTVEYYALGDGTILTGTRDGDNYPNCHNPLSYGSYSGNVEAWCGGNGPVTSVTCQTTKP